MARKMRLEGLENVRRVFRALPDESLRRITNALNQGLEEIETEARVAAPKGKQAPHMRDTIRKTDIRVRADGKSAVGYVTAGDTPATASAAFRSEYGRAPGGSGKVDMSSHPGHAKQPFLFPAYWVARQKAVGRVRREISRAARFVSGLRGKA